MSRLAPLVGLLLVGLLIGATLSLQSNQILIPFIVQQRVVYNPSFYLNNLTLVTGQAGSISLPNIMRAVIYMDSASITASTQVMNTPAAFFSLKFTLHFGGKTLVLDGLSNATAIITLNQGLYPVSLTIDYATIAYVHGTIQGSVTIILSTQ